MEINNNIVNLADFKQAQDLKRQRLVIQQQAKLRLMANEAKRHPLGLYKLCFSDSFGEPVTLKWFHKEWTDLILNHSHVMIEAPRGSTKTTWVCAIVLWFLGQDPNLRIKIVCGNDEKAKKRLAEIKSHVVNDPLYQYVFPHVKLDSKARNDASMLTLMRDSHSRESSIEAKGVLSDGTGDRADIIIFDDVCTLKNSVQEPSTRPKVLQKMQGDWLNTLDSRRGRVICIFTPWHEQDANAVLKKNVDETWAYKRYAHGRPGNPFFSIFEELFNQIKLKRLCKQIGIFEYTRAYLCSLMSGMTQIVRSEWLHEYTPYDLPATTLNKVIAYISVDPTGSKNRTQAVKSKDPDYYGFTVLLVDLEDANALRPKAPNRVYVPEAYQVRLSMAHAAYHALELSKRWGAEAILVEAQGQSSLHDWIYEADKTVQVIPIPATLSKQQRLESITPMLQDPSQRILFHPKTIEIEPPENQTITINKLNDVITVEVMRDLRNQLLNFPTVHDDGMDSLVQGLRYIKQFVLPSDSAGDDEDDEDDSRAPSVTMDIRTLAC